MAGLNELLVGNKKFVSGTVVNPVGIREMRMNIIDYPRIPTGIFPLDYALAGGIPFNVITQLYGPYQGGKCLGKGTPILMYDGTIKSVEEVQVGDLLMGPDSKPRTVMSLARGREEMFRVIPVFGDSYVVNRSHILSLKMAKGSTESCSRQFADGTIVNMPIDAYLATSASFKNFAKGWRTGVDFQTTELPKELPPYILGVWLGDGHSRKAAVTTADEEVVAACREYANGNDMYLMRGADCGKAVTYEFSKEGPNQPSEASVMRKALIEQGVWGDKHIPHAYLTASRKDRLQLIAGLLDTDGSVNKNFYEITQKRRRLAEDICFLARSLGFAASMRETTKTCTNTNASGTYYKVSIFGQGVHEIPCRIARKRIVQSEKVRNRLLVGIKVESIGEGYYYGFEIDGDHLFMLGDFTVTHNTTTSYLIAKSLSKTCMRCLKPLKACKCQQVDFVDTCPTCGSPAGSCDHKSQPVSLCSGCGKTRITCTCGSQLRQKTFLAQFEGMPPDEIYFETLGYDTTNNMIVGLPEYGEQGCEMIAAAVQADDCGLVIVDSLAGIVPKEELECDFEDAKVALQARLIKRLFLRLNVLLTKEYRRGHLVSVIFINQIRTIIGAGKFESNETTPGGHTAKHGYRLSVRVNQLSLDSDKGEMDKQEHMKNVLRFSASLLGPQAKQQMLILAGKCEYKIALRDYKGFEPGTPLDANTCIQVAKDIGMLEKQGKYYVLGRTGLRFLKLSDIDRVFQTGDYINPETGEVICTEADELIRYAVLRYAVTASTAAILERSKQKLVRIQNPSCQVTPQELPKSESESTEEA